MNLFAAIRRASAFSKVCHAQFRQYLGRHPKECESATCVASNGRRSTESPGTGPVRPIPENCVGETLRIHARTHAKNKHGFSAHDSNMKRTDQFHSQVSPPGYSNEDVARAIVGQRVETENRNSWKAAEKKESGKNKTKTKARTVKGNIRMSGTDKYAHISCGEKVNEGERRTEPIVLGKVGKNSGGESLIRISREEEGNGGFLSYRDGKVGKKQQRKSDWCRPLSGRKSLGKRARPYRTARV